jgi:7-cyano-7-deazaguanine synthase
MIATVLLSGGLDSAACVALLKKTHEVHALFVNHSQQALRQERLSAKRIARHYDIHLTELTLRAGHAATGEVMGRNAAFVFSALMQWDRRSGLLAIGVHRGTPYYDCSERFVHDVASIVSAYTDGILQLVAPFLQLTKRELVAFCREADVPIHLTYSCERGTSPPCGRCTSCQDRKKANI